MKSTKKILAVIMALVLSFSALSVMAFAAPVTSTDPCKVTVDIEVSEVPGVKGIIPADYETTWDDTYTNDQVYRADVYLTSSHTLTAFQIRTYIDKNAMYPVDSQGNQTIPAGSACFTTKGDCLFNETYSKYVNAKGQPAPNFRGNKAHMGGIGQADWQHTKSPDLSATADVEAGVNSYGFLSQWKCNYAANHLLISGSDDGNKPAVPTWGRNLMYSFYFAVKEDAPEGTYTIGINDGQVDRCTGAYTIHNVRTTKAVGDAILNTDSILPEHVTYNSATITVGNPPVEKSPLEQSKRFWRQTPGGTPDEDVQLKVRSTITRADLAKALDTDVARLNDAIKANVKYVGFAMATKNTIYNEDLIAAAENAGKKVTGTKSGDILAGLNNWVVDDNTNIQFGAVVETSKTSLATPAYYTAFIILNDNTVIRYTNPVEISAADLKA